MAKKEVKTNLWLYNLLKEANIDLEPHKTREVLKEATDKEKEETLKDTAVLHEDLQNDGSLKDIDTPSIVSRSLPVLKETGFMSFSIDDLIDDTIKTDDQRIYCTIRSNLIRSNIALNIKKNRNVSQFLIVHDSKIIYEFSYADHLIGAKCIVITPQSSMTEKTSEEQSIKANTLKKVH